MKRLLKLALSALYGLVMIEIIIMASPFAFYWYSIYGPLLQGLDRWQATAWLEAFFLPHSVITMSPTLEFLRWQVGTYSVSIGIIGFCLCAAQIYWSKLLRRGAVNSWIYSLIRHPQYLFLAIAAFGLLTMWPRIIILVFYLGMLITYYFLARFEENQMEAKHSDYAEYRRRTAMFIPGDPGGRLFRATFGRIPNRAAALTASMLTLTALTIGASVMVRHYTIAHSATEVLPQERTLAIATWPISKDTIRQVVTVGLRDMEVRAALANEPDAVFTAHVLPADYGMVEMFADVDMDHRMFTQLSRHRFRYLLDMILPSWRVNRRAQIMGTPQQNYRVVFSRVDGPHHHPLPISGITGLEAKMTPVIIADIGGQPPSLLKTVTPPRRSFWGDVTMPMF